MINIYITTKNDITDGKCNAKGRKDIIEKELTALENIIKQVRCKINEYKR